MSQFEIFVDRGVQKTDYKNMILAYKYRLLPRKGQHKALNGILEDQRRLYNQALAARKDSWENDKKSLSYFDQAKALTIQRAKDASLAKWPANLQRGTLKRVDEAFKGFFRRVKRGQKAGYPRFKGKGWFKSFAFTAFPGVRFKAKRLHIKGLEGGIRIHFHRPMPEGKPKGLVVRKDSKGWLAVLLMEVETAPKAKILRRYAGIDMGLENLVVSDDGTAVPNPRAAKKAERELRRRQRALSRCKKKSKRRKKVRAKLAKAHEKVKNIRGTYLHQVAAKIVKDFDLIAVEDLDIKQMMAKDKKGPRLAKSIADASWGRLIELVAYKAERAGKRLVKVPPHYTSQDCSGCGTRVRKSLSVRTHKCPSCGLVLCRDQNAARNILHKAVVGLGEHNVAGYGVRACGNISLEISN